MENGLMFTIVNSSDNLLIPVSINVSQDQFNEYIKKVRENNHIVVEERNISSVTFSFIQYLYLIVRNNQKELVGLTLSSRLKDDLI